MNKALKTADAVPGRKWPWLELLLLMLVALTIGSAWFIGPADPSGTGLVHLTSGLLLSIKTMPADFHSRALVVLAVIVLATRIFGRGAEMLGFPAVLGEICVGLLISPALLGGVFPGVLEVLRMPSVAGSLGTVSQFGIILFLFVVGMEFDERQLRQRVTAASRIAVPGVLVCMLASLPLSMVLHERFAPAADQTVFGLFIGLAMSIAALPVLVRMLEQRGLARTEIGQTAIATATLDDIAGWGLLALILAIAKGHLVDAARTAVLLLCYAVVVWTVIRPLVRTAHVQRLLASGSKVQLPVLVVILLLGSAAATEWVGVHALFGAFVAGLVIPADSQLARDMRERLYPLAVSLFLPVYFVYSGSRVADLDLGAWDFWWACLLVIATAFISKLWGTYFGSRWAGMSRRDAWRMGLLLNNRGLMELVVLNIGLDTHAISPAVFTMFILMTVTTTAASCWMGGFWPIDGAGSAARQGAA